MTEPATLDETSPARRRLLGASFVLLGLGMAVMVKLNPEQANVPLWVVWCCCATFVFAGVAVGTYSAASPGRYRWSIVATLACMACVPAWVAFGPGARNCTSNIAEQVSEASCRGMFGVGTVMLVFMFVVALRQALGRTS